MFKIYGNIQGHFFFRIYRISADATTGHIRKYN